MKENKYDDPVFFEKYSQMSRSQKGLAGAGEWHALKEMLPPLFGKRVLDLGCGYGWHCIYAAQAGASVVFGVDISAKMLQKAKEQTPYPQVVYIQSPMEDISFDENCFDFVLSSLALHYVEDFSAICKKVEKTLVKGGSFVFSVEHPTFTAQGTQDWIYGENGQPLYWPVDHYFTEGKRKAIFLGEPVTKYHRTLSTYLNTLLETGFSIERIEEPKPDPVLLESDPQLSLELRRPMMLIIHSKKQ